MLTYTQPMANDKGARMRFQKKVEFCMSRYHFRPCIRLEGAKHGLVRADRGEIGMVNLVIFCCVVLVGGQLAMRGILDGNWVA